jgi:transcriptional regulator with XRE-family HTH domain
MASRVRAAEPLVEFAAALRRLRKRAGQPTLRAMARRVPCSAATLCRAESGTRVPSLGATLAYVRACGGDEELWRAQHAQLLAARREDRRVVFYPWRGFTPGRDEEPDELTAAVEAYLLDRGGVESLAGAMRRMRAESGMTLAQVAERTALPEIAEQIGGKGLPVSTIGDLCNPAHRRVPSKRTLRGFLLALEAPEAALSMWEEARQILAAGASPQAHVVKIRTRLRQSSAATQYSQLIEALRCVEFDRSTVDAGWHPETSWIHAVSTPRSSESTSVLLRNLLDHLPSNASPITAALS